MKQDSKGSLAPKANGQKMAYKRNPIVLNDLSLLGKVVRTEKRPRIKHYKCYYKDGVILDPTPSLSRRNRVLSSKIAAIKKEIGYREVIEYFVRVFDSEMIISSSEIQSYLDRGAKVHSRIVNKPIE